MAVRVIAAILLAVLAYVASVLLFIRSEKGGRDLCALAQAALKDVAHERVVIGHCAVDPINTQVVIDDVEIGPPERLLFGADKLSVSVDHRGFLSGKLLVSAVEIARPRFSTDLSARSTEAPTTRRRPPSAACLPDVSRLQVGLIKITDGSFHALLPDERGLALEGVNVTIKGGVGEQLKIMLDARRTVLADAEGSTSATRTIVEGTFDFAAGTAQLDRVEVKAPEGTLTAHGALENICLLQGSVVTKLDVDMGRLHQHLLRKIPNLAGTATMSAKVKFKADHFEAQLNADVRDSEVLDFLPGNFTIDAVATPERLLVKEVRLPLEGGAIVAKGSLDLAVPFRVEATATLDGFVLGELLEHLGAPGLPVQLAGSGEAHLAGPLEGPTGMSLEGGLDLRMTELGVYNRSWRRRKKPDAVRYVGLTKGTLKSDFRLTDHELRLQRTQLSTHQTDITLAGTVAFDPKRGLALTVDAPRVALGDLGPFARATCLGQGSIHGTITGPYAALDIDADTDFHDLKVINYELGDVKSSVRIDLQNDTLAVTHVEATKGETSYEGGARLSFRDAVTIDGRVSLDAARATDLIGIAQGNVPFLTSVGDNVEGFLTGDVVLSGLAARPTIDAQLDIAALRLYGQRFESGLVRARLVDASDLNVTRLRLRHGFGEVAGTGSLRLADGHYQIALASQKLRAVDLDGLARSLPRIQGGLSVSLKGEGTLDDPRAVAQVTLSDLRVGDQPLATTRMTLNLSGKTLSADGTIASPWPDGVTRPRHESGTGFARPPRSMLHAIHATVELHDDLPFDLQATMDVPDVGVMLKPGALKGVDAELRGDMHVSGMALRPLLSTVAELNLTRLRVRQGPTALENSAPVHAVFKDGVLAFDAFPLRGTAFNLDASGTWTLIDSSGAFGLYGPKSIALQGHLDLAILKKLVADLEEARGDLAVNFELSNRAGKDLLASIQGNATLSNVLLRVKNAPVDIELANGEGSVSCNFPITQKNGVIGMQNGTISVENISALLNGASMSVTGDVKVDDNAIRDIALAMNLDNIPFRVDGTPLVIAGTPVFTRKRATETAVDGGERRDEYVNTLGGDLKVVRFNYQRDLDLERTLVNAVDFSRRPPAPKVFKKAGEFLKLDMGLTFGDVRVNNNLLKAQLDGNLRLTGTFLHPGLIGAITFSEGKATVRNIEYTVSSGVINFIDRSSVSSTFDLRADAHVSHSQTEYTIHVTANGTPQQPKLLLSSEPTLSDGDILTLLTLGIINSDLDHTGSASIGGVLVDAAYNASGVSEQMKRLLPQNDLLKDTQFKLSSDYNEQTGNIEPVAQLEMKVIKDSWKLRGQTSLLGARGRKAQLEVKLRNSLDAQGQWDGDKPSAPSYGDFGADLRLHWEQQ